VVHQRAEKGGSPAQGVEQPRRRLQPVVPRRAGGTAGAVRAAVLAMSAESHTTSAAPLRYTPPGGSGWLREGEVAAAAATAALGWGRL
jgi:hypothetical protein